MENIGTMELWIIILAIAIYFLPSIISYNHKNANSIIILFFLLTTINTNLFAQENIKLKYYKDIMTDKEYIFSKEKIMCLENPKKGFVVKVTYEITKGIIKYSGISVLSNDIGNCVEHNNLIFLFDDGTKIEITSWNDFNCEGRSYFDFDSKKLEKLTKRIKAIRFQNGRTYDSSTKTLENEKDKTYFIDVKQAIDKQVYEIVDKYE